MVSPRRRVAGSLDSVIARYGKNIGGAWIRVLETTPEPEYPFLYSLRLPTPLWIIEWIRTTVLPSRGVSPETSRLLPSALPQPVTRQITWARSSSFLPLFNSITDWNFVSCLYSLFHKCLFPPGTCSKVKPLPLPVAPLELAAPLFWNTSLKDVMSRSTTWAFPRMNLIATVSLRKSRRLKERASMRARSWRSLVM